MFFRSNTILEFYLYASNREESELIYRLDRAITVIAIVKNILSVQHVHQCKIDINIPILHVIAHDPLDIQLGIIGVAS